MKHTMTVLGSLILLILLLSSTPESVVMADYNPMCAWSPETGQNIHGAFLNFYLTHNGRENFGLPITDAFIENGSLVQYFERARLEFHAESPESFRVQLGLLGQQFGVTDPPIKAGAIPPASSQDFTYFPNTGQMITLAMKKYFETHGGVDVLGYPITGLRFEGNEFVQYFQRQRLVWNTIDSGPNAVRPSPVGQMLLARMYPSEMRWQRRLPSDWCGNLDDVIKQKKTLTPVPTPTPKPLSVTALNLNVQSRIQQPGVTGPQYIDVTITDQSGRPIPSVALYANVRLATGDRYFPLLSSDTSGKSFFSFELNDQPANSLVVVQIHAFLDGLATTDSDTFTVYR